MTVRAPPPLPQSVSGAIPHGGCSLGWHTRSPGCTGVPGGGLCGSRLASVAQLDELDKMFSDPPDPAGMYSDCDVSSIGLAVAPTRARQPKPAKAHKCLNEARGCDFSSADRTNMLKHCNHHCPLATSAVWTCKYCCKSCSSNPATKRAHKTGCRKKRAEMDARLAARPPLSPAAMANLSPDQLLIWGAGVSTKFDGSEETELREGSAYDPNATSPLGGAAITGGLVKMLGVRCKHMEKRTGTKQTPFSQVKEGRDMTRLRRLIQTTCPVIGGVLKDPLFGKPVTFGSRTANPLSLEAVNPNKEHSWDNITLVPLCTQVAHHDKHRDEGREGIGKTVAEYERILRTMLLMFDPRPPVKEAVRAALDAHLAAVRLNLTNTPAGNGVWVDETDNSGTYGDKRNALCRLYDVNHNIRSRVETCIRIDAKMNAWTAEQTAVFRSRFRRKIENDMRQMFLDGGACCQQTGIPIGPGSGAFAMSLNRRRNQGKNAAHFRVTVNVNTRALEIDYSNIEWIGRMMQGHGGHHDMSKKLFLFALLHSPLRLPRTAGRMAAVQDAYDAL
jgi:hypothetical protein